MGCSGWTKYGNQRLEASCKRALFFDNDSYKSIKTILTQGLETNDPMQEQQKSSGKVALPREASYLRSCADIEPNNITREASI